MANLSTKTGLPSFSQDQSSFINYFLDPGFERGVNNTLPAGWGQYNSTAALPGSGTGGAAVAQVTMLSSNSSPIRGTLSAVITKDAANRQGVGYSYPFTISQADKGITAGVEIDIQTSANYVSGDMIFMIYDVTNSIAITPRNVPLPKLDNYGKFISDYGLTAGTSYRFILHIATVNASAWTVKVDTMVNTTTRVAQPGTAFQDWQPIQFPNLTSSQVGTGNATNTAEYMRIGSTMIAKIRCLKDGTGGSGTGAVAWSMPSGLTINTSLLPSGSLLGNAGFTGTNYGPRTEVQAISTTVFTVGKSGANTKFTGADFTSNGEVNFELIIPINEWTSGANFGPSSQLEYLSTPFSSYIPYRGSDGTLIPTTTPAGTNEQISMGPLPWLNAQQATDSLDIEYQHAGGTNPWMPLPAADILPLTFDGTNYLGIGIVYSGGNYVVLRGKYRTNGAGTWGSIAANSRYRIVKANPTAPVGVSVAGLIQPGNVSSEFTSVEQDIAVIGWQGTTPPSGTITKKYKWNKVGKLVTLEYRIEASVAGVSIGGVTFLLPTDVPSPKIFSTSALSTWQALGSGGVFDGTAVSLFTPGSCSIYRGASGDFTIYTFCGPPAGLAAKFAFGTISWLTA